MKKIVRAWLVSLLWEGALRKIKRETPRVVTITGSVGKTSVKEAIALVLEGSAKPVQKTEGGFNTEIGVPLSLLGFRQTPSGLLGIFRMLWRSLVPPISNQKNGYLVLEYSADQPGDIAYLTKKVAGNIRVLTSIVPVHMERYANFESLVTEKHSLFTKMREEDVAILNADDPHQKKLGSLKNIVWYGFQKFGSKKPGVWAGEPIMTTAGLQFSLEFVVTKQIDMVGGRQSQTITVHSSLLGKHQLYALLAAAAVGFEEGISPQKIKYQLEKYLLPAGRGRLIKGKRDMQIIDDTYNSSPESVKSGLDMLQYYAKGKRSVAILGTMNELGDYANQAHEEIAQRAAVRAQYLIAIGEFSSKMVKVAVEAGMSPQNCIAFQTPEQAIHKIDQLVKKEDVIFIKGSQNKVRLERLVFKLMAHPEQAETLLTRQSAYWKKKL